MSGPRHELSQHELLQIQNELDEDPESWREWWRVTPDRLAGFERLPSSGPVTVELHRRIHFEYFQYKEFIAAGTIELVDGRYQVFGLTFAPTVAVTSEFLHSLAVGRIVMNAVRQASESEPRIVRTDTNETVTRSVLTTDERVLVLYHLARAAGENTNVVIAEQLGISKSGAAQRVAKLRRPEIGWLPPAKTQGAHR